MNLSLQAFSYLHIKVQNLKVYCILVIQCNIFPNCYGSTSFLWITQFQSSFYLYFKGHPLFLQNSLFYPHFYVINQKAYSIFNDQVENSKPQDLDLMILYQQPFSYIIIKLVLHMNIFFYIISSIPFSLNLYLFYYVVIIMIDYFSIFQVLYILTFKQDYLNSLIPIKYLQA